MAFSKSLKAIVIDFDGTLYDLEVDWDKARHVLGLKPGDNLQAYLGNLEGDRRVETHVILEQLELEGLTQKLDEQVVQNLERLTQYYEVIIFSRNSKLVIEKILSNLSFKNKITIIGRDYLEVLKPNTTALRRVLDEREIKYSDTIVIGDTLHDVIVANDIGAKCVIIKNSRNQFTPEGATLYVQNFNEAVEKVLKEKYE